MSVDYRFPQVGIIRKGGEKGASRPGTDLNYFRVVFNEGEDTLAAKFLAVYGKEPKAINIILPFDDPATMWESWLEAYGGSGAKVMMVDPDTEQVHFQLDSTGKIIVRNGYHIDGGTVKWDHGPAYSYTRKDGKHIDVYPTLHCRLRVIVPELEELVFFTVKTTSWNDRRNLRQQLWAYYHLMGSVKGAYVLRRTEQWMISTFPDGRKVRQKKSLLRLDTTSERAKSVLDALASTTSPSLPASPPPTCDVVETDEDRFWRLLREFDIEDQAGEFLGATEDYKQAADLLEHTMLMPDDAE